MIDEWSGDYRTTFLALEEDKALDNMTSSITELSRSELAIELMAVALSNQDQEDEHSCFSDNTHRDIRLNLEGVANVYNGSYNNSTDAASLASLITEAKAVLGAELNTLLSTAIILTNNTLIPFDLAIVNGATITEGAKEQLAVQALVAFGNKLLEARVALGINYMFNMFNFKLNSSLFRVQFFFHLTTKSIFQ
jgi:putative iron-regulated protein